MPKVMIEVPVEMIPNEQHLRIIQSQVEKALPSWLGAGKVYAYIPRGVMARAIRERDDQLDSGAYI